MFFWPCGKAYYSIVPGENQGGENARPDPIGGGSGFGRGGSGDPFFTGAKGGGRGA